MLLLKGHQIIGELRHEDLASSDKDLYWKVTRSLVSYDKSNSISASSYWIERSPDHWWVTTNAMLFNYGVQIERSPDHWWVTTKELLRYQLLFRLKGHQIIGELRLFHFCQHLGTDGLKGHQIIGELRQRWARARRRNIQLKGHQIIGELRHILHSHHNHRIRLKGHQIIGELRLGDWGFNVAYFIERSPDHWWVTTFPYITISMTVSIERSPDHWWVTTSN